MILQDMEPSDASDSELLAAWVAHRRESAFGALVARYATLVHMAAKRTCGDDSLAADASQLVFILLAQKAQALTTHPTLAGWLHVTAVMKTRDLIDKARRESRKRGHFSAAMETRTHAQTPDAWLEIQPVLDAALAALSAKDREALLLRFYRSLSVREIAKTLGIATAAAQKRIDRATERLRGKLIRRGCQAGGSLSAALLAGFAADAESATLPVSLLASKAIAAGTVSSFSLAALITSIATLMKSTASIPPLIALIVAGAWTGTKYQALSAMETKNSLLLEKIAAVRSPQQTTPVKHMKDDGPIDWKKLAAEKGKGPETLRFENRLKSMTREEMITALDRITGLDCSKDRRSSLESTVADTLMIMDPEWVLNHFSDRLRDDSRQNLRLDRAFEIWAGRNLRRATAWFDSQTAAGAFDGKALGQRSGSSTRYSFEAVLLGLLLPFDPAAAGRRMGAMPQNDRIEVMDSLAWRLHYQGREERTDMAAFAALVRSQIPAEQQVAVLFQAAPYFRNFEDYPAFSAYLEKIQATSAERIACTEKFAGANINRISNYRKVNRQDIDTIRGWFREIAPDDMDSCSGRILSEAMSNRVTSMRLEQASEIALDLLETGGTDEVLATLLETTELDKNEVKLALDLTSRIQDETRRAAIVKHLETLTFP